MEATSSVRDLQILQKPEWTDVRLGPSYRVTVRVIGDDIVHSQQHGSLALRDLGALLELIESIVREHIGTRRRHVHIADYTGLKGTSAEARRHFIEYVSTSRNLSVSSSGRVTDPEAVTVGPLAPPGRPISSRGQLRAGAGAGPPKHAIRAPASAYPTPAAAAPRDPAARSSSHVPQSDWSYEHRGFSLRWEVIDYRVLHGIAAGTLRSEHIDPVFAAIDRMLTYGPGNASRHGDLDITELRR
jgi:hypothetical protein